MIHIFSPIVLIGTILFAYFVQKRCIPGHLKFRGKKLELPQKLATYNIVKVSVKNGKYYADGCIYDTGDFATIEIDGDVMEHIPSIEKKDGPLLQVMVYEEPNGFSLAEEELRYKIGIQAEDESVTTRMDMEYAEYVIWFLYEIRNILLTIAAIGVYRSPHISIFLSTIAFVIQFRNVIPLRFTKLSKHGIIEATKEAKSATKDTDFPPGYDAWSDNQKFLYHANQRMQANEQNLSTDNEIDFPEEESCPEQNQIDEDESVLDVCQFDESSHKFNDLPDVDESLLISAAEPIPEDDDEFEVFTPPEEVFYQMEDSEREYNEDKSNLQGASFEPSSSSEEKSQTRPSIPEKDDSKNIDSGKVDNPQSSSMAVRSFFQQGQLAQKKEPPKPHVQEKESVKEKEKASDSVRKFVRQTNIYANETVSSSPKRDKTETPRQTQRPIQQKKSENIYDSSSASEKNNSGPKELNKKKNRGRQRGQKEEANKISKLAGENIE